MIRGLQKRLNDQSPDIITEAHKKAIQKLDTGDFHLSWSKMSRFKTSPWALVCYMANAFTEEKILAPPTPAMMLGRLEHMVVLEPKRVFEEFGIYQKADPEKTWAVKINRDRKKVAVEYAERNGREAIPVEMLLDTIERKNLIFGNKLAGELIKGCKYFERKIEFEWKGYNWLGYIDAGCDGYKIDLKKVTDAIPRKLKWRVIDFDFPGQGYLYNIGTGGNPKAPFYNICIDAAKNICVTQCYGFDFDASQARLELLIDKFNMCRSEGLWYMNQEFWQEENGYWTFENLKNSY